MPMCEDGNWQKNTKGPEDQISLLLLIFPIKKSRLRFIATINLGVYLLMALTSVRVL
ncbi:hypothetical protein D3C71_2193450 [compost metagenome]